VRCFDIDITRNGPWWRVHIPEINELTKTRHRGQAERMAREHIALNTGTPIAEVAVRILGGQFWTDRCLNLKRRAPASEI
jgi:hypothetical protein